MSLWDDMTEQNRFNTLRNMTDYGSSFAAYIAHAWMQADSFNEARLIATFPDLIEKFQPKNWSAPCVNA